METYPETRAAAKLINSQFYYTGKPCKYGHVAIRETRKGHCRTCRELEWGAAAEGRAEYFSAYNKSEKGQANKRKYYDDNREEVIARAKARPVTDKDAYRKKWADKNPEDLKARVNTRRRRYKQATPKWETEEDRKTIRELHKLAMQLTQTTGVKYVVDHEIPIQGVLVSGLHTPKNLQVITAKENGLKSNKYEIE